MKPAFRGRAAPVIHFAVQLKQLKRLGVTPQQTGRRTGEAEQIDRGAGGSRALPAAPRGAADDEAHEQPGDSRRAPEGAGPEDHGDHRGPAAAEAAETSGPMNRRERYEQAVRRPL